jgi:hypothetical protein
MGAEAKRYCFIVSGNIISEWGLMELIYVVEDLLRTGPYVTVILNANLGEAGH